jgi:hypothetical protein
MTLVTVTVPEKTVTQSVDVQVPASTQVVSVNVPASVVTRDVTIVVPAYTIQVDVPDTPPAPTPTLAVPYVASIDHGTGRPAAADLFDTYVKNGYNGWVEYQTPSQPTNVSNTMKTIASRHGNERIALQQTCKTHSDAGLQAVLAWLPDAWCDDYIYNYFQEPEDNMVGNASAQKAYRDTYTAAAKVIKANNQANPSRKVSWPYLELAEYSLELLYQNGDASRSPDLFRPPDTDYAGVLWSVFEYAEKPDDARLQQAIDNVLRAMGQFFPGKKWGIMASGYTLEPCTTSDASVYNYSATQRQNQAKWLTAVFTKALAASPKPEQIGWYNVKYAGTGGAYGECRVEVIPETLAAFKALPR